MKFNAPLADSKRMKSNSLFLFSFLLATGLAISSEVARADGLVRSEFVFQIDNSVFNGKDYELAANLQGQDTAALADVVITDPAPVEIRGITAEYAYKLTSGTKTIFMGAEHLLTAEDLSAKLQIREASIDTIIERIEEGVKVRMRVQGRCNNLTLTLPKGKASLVATLRTSIDAQGLPEVKVPRFSVAWPADAWSIADFNCTGVDGFKEELQKGLQKYLGDSSNFQAELRRALDQRLAQIQADTRTKFLEAQALNISLPGVKATLRPRKIQNIRGDRFQIVGTVDFLFASASVNQIVDVVGGVVPATAPAFALLLPEKLLNALNDMSYKTGQLKLRQRGQEIPAFKDLLSGDVSKVIVWPELQYYPADADFLFDFAPQSKPVIGELKDLGDGTLSSSLNASLDALVWAPLETKNGHQRMITFQTPVQGPMRLYIDRTASGGPELKGVFSELTMNLTGFWDEVYARTRMRSVDVSLATFQSEISDSLKTKGLGVTLGTFTVLARKNLTPVSLGKSGGWLILNWD